LKSSLFGFLKSSKAKIVKELLSNVGAASAGGAAVPIAGGAPAAATAGAAKEPAKEKDESGEEVVRDSLCQASI
jgi:ribosomal protein L12E/L44/L45/RPP1/RPP2